jgi:hypothetical protein
MQFTKSILRPCDTILYFSRDLIDWAIALKSWTKVAHVEWYRGDDVSYASRNGVGVGRYFLRTDGIAAVLRPKRCVNLPAIDAWFETVNGQKYDWKGLLCFTLAVRQGAKDKMFCSEFWTRLQRAGWNEPFNPSWDADRVPPSFMLVTPTHELIWSDGDLF